MRVSLTAGKPVLVMATSVSLELFSREPCCQMVLTSEMRAPPADLSGAGAGGDQLGHEVLKVYGAVLEARGVQVGDVVAHHTHGFPITV